MEKSDKDIVYEWSRKVWDEELNKALDDWILAQANVASDNGSEDEERKAHRHFNDVLRNKVRLAGPIPGRK